MTETLLGFDFGVRRIGVSIGNSLTRSARALAVVPSEPLAARWAAIAALMAEWRPQRLVVGRPLHPDGAALPVTPACERFARQLEARFRLPVEMVDESFSSVEARALRGQERAGRVSSDQPLDDEAAAVILRQYLLSC